MNGPRRQSLWHGSTGSIPSSNGSFSYQSSPPFIQAPAVYQHQTSPQSVRQTPSFGENGTVLPQLSPPQYQQQPNLYQPGQYQVPHSMPYSQAPQQQYPQPQQQQFNFNESTFQNAAFSTAPNQQFATWGGYNGPFVQDTLDDENAVPPKINPWDLKQK